MGEAFEQLALCRHHGVIKSGKVVIVLQGRFAGRKAIVVKAYDDGNAERRFAHAMVAAIDRAPRKVTRSMSKEKIQKRTKMKPFLKYVNYTHPCRRGMWWTST